MNPGEIHVLEDLAQIGLAGPAAAGQSENERLGCIRRAYPRGETVAFRPEDRIGVGAGPSPGLETARQHLGELGQMLVQFPAGVAQAACLVDRHPVGTILLDVVAPRIIAGGVCNRLMAGGAAPLEIPGHRLGGEDVVVATFHADLILHEVFDDYQAWN